ncbi:MAG: 4Fe-4S dicluster domain-containing protein [Synergistaceae bacterium]|jgi:ferredoxin like protein|nr:4Fe-4S dicluster domain-containing protein [Synergistaceae bacterium]
MSIDEKLGVDKIIVDEENAHIIIDKQYSDDAEKRKLIKICPAGLYKMEEDGGGNLTFDYIGCLECGACRAISLGKVVSGWNHPAGAMGVEYRMG